MNAMKAAWTVKAGIIPGMAIPEHGRQWLLTSRDLDGKSDQQRGEAYSARADEAMTYAREIMNPRFLNWVTVEFVWL